MALVERLPVGPDTAQWPLWSTTARVVVSGSHRDPGLVAEARRITERVCADVDRAASRFRPDAEIHWVAANAGDWVLVSPLLAELVRVSLEAAQRTDGLVDPTVADAMQRLGYDRDISRLSPETSLSRAVRVVARRAAGWRSVRFDGHHVQLPEGVSLDLGATAKAWAADESARQAADALGVGVLVSLGGDIATAGVARQGHWSILVSDGPGQPEAHVALPAGHALATSSTISRTWRRGGQSMHHVLDPRTSLPAPTVWRTVSAAAPSCVQANTWTTAAIVRGQSAIPWLREHGVTARLVSAGGDVVRVGGWPGERAA
jgi:thiamine biosynthesis lipoprotein